MIKIIKNIFLFFITISLLASKMFSQEDPSLFLYKLENSEFTNQQNQLKQVQLNSSTFKWHDPITKLPEDFGTIGTQIFSESGIKTIAELTLLTGALISVDHETKTPFRDTYRSSRTIHDMSKNISWLGGGEFHLILASAFGATGLVLNNQRALQTALQILEAELATGITVQILKRISGRESPQSASHIHGLFRPFPNLEDYHRDETKYYSFPSGHISSSVAVLTVIAENYPHIRWIKPVGYSVIGLIGIGLVARGWHWFSDYPLAVAIGYSFGKIITGRNDVLQEDDDSNSWFLYPAGMGVGFSYRF